MNKKLLKVNTQKIKNNEKNLLLKKTIIKKTMKTTHTFKRIQKQIKLLKNNCNLNMNFVKLC